MRSELTAWCNKFMYFYDRLKRSILLRKNHTQLKSCVVVDLDKSHASFRRKTWIQAGKVDMRSSSYGTWHRINYYLLDKDEVHKYTDIRFCRNHMGIKIYWLYSSLYPHAHNLSVHDMNFLRFTSESQTRTELRLRLRKADLTQSRS